MARRYDFADDLLTFLCGFPWGLWGLGSERVKYHGVSGLFVPRTSLLCFFSVYNSVTLPTGFIPYESNKRLDNSTFIINQQLNTTTL